MQPSGNGHSKEHAAELGIQTEACRRGELLALAATRVLPPGMTLFAATGQYAYPEYLTKDVFSGRYLAYLLCRYGSADVIAEGDKFYKYCFEVPAAEPEITGRLTNGLGQFKAYLAEHEPERTWAPQFSPLAVRLGATDAP